MHPDCLQAYTELRSGQTFYNVPDIHRTHHIQKFPTNQFPLADFRHLRFHIFIQLCQLRTLLFVSVHFKSCSQANNSVTPQQRDTYTFAATGLRHLLKSLTGLQLPHCYCTISNLRRTFFHIFLNWRLGYCVSFFESPKNILLEEHVALLKEQ
jgi:hypothetical protein